MRFAPVAPAPSPHHILASEQSIYKSHESVRNCHPEPKRGIFLARSQALAWKRTYGRSSGQAFMTLERQGLAPTLERGSQRRFA